MEGAWGAARQELGICRTSHSSTLVMQELPLENCLTQGRGWVENCHPLQHHLAL